MGVQGFRVQGIRGRWGARFAAVRARPAAGASVLASGPRAGAKAGLSTLAAGLTGLVGLVGVSAWVGLPEAGAQQIRCWTNANGSRECSDLPPPPTAKSINQVRGRAGSIDGQASFAQTQAAQRFPVILWSSDCGEPCSNARKLLTGRGVPFTERNPAMPALQEEFKALTRGQMQVPMLIVGTSQLTGFEEGQWNATLDAAGYSRTPSGPLRKPATTAATPRPAPVAQAQQAPGKPGGIPPGMPIQTGPGGTVVPPPPGPQNDSSPGFAPLPETSGGPGSSPAGPVPNAVR